MLTIDGSHGEGGGQVLRTSLALSLVTGRPFRITDIRAGRERPGLLSQHLTAVEAATAVGRAEVTGDELGSPELCFHPRGIEPGEYRFAVGTAGSATLVLTAVLPALLTAGGPSHLVLEGGTHNPWAPPFDFLSRAFLPLVERMGPRLEARLDRPGFYPAGGGRFEVTVTPTDPLTPFDLLERGEIRGRHARAVVSRLPRRIAERELEQLRRCLDWELDCFAVEETGHARGPGNVVMVELTCDHLTELFTGFGRRGLRAEKVASDLATEVHEYLSTGVAVGPYLADQLLVPMALAGGGRFRTMPPTAHTTTNREIVQEFLDCAIDLTQLEGGVCEIAIR